MDEDKHFILQIAYCLAADTQEWKEMGIDQRVVELCDVYQSLEAVMDGTLTVEDEIIN